ncbi:oligosaccharide flippase family protein [Actinomycetospora sp. TBRC 11914]|uniref:lipopolysaccharide biosynthesis protein n=1 Tax=Actinomycetospora sp. TBRC 11914 TaxID=2729387 RepID=UPI00145D64B9|nr:oligosaccharide flippase family protein [Actinomycetospora sp. TBRC 11914]NMO90440.1 oligosaccharide flippase family protein [Actinomycetospora sp. TBRC 11914]
MTEAEPDSPPTSGRRPGGTLSLFLGRIGGVAGALVVGQVVLGVTYVVGARAISPATLGLVATCAAIGQVAATVVDLGLVNYLVRETAAGRLDDARARAVVAAKRPWALALLLVVGLATSLVLAPDVVSAILLAVVGIGVWEAQNANGLLRARERFARASTGQLVGRVGGLVVAVVLALLGVGTLALAAALPASFLLEALLDRVFLGPAGERRRPGRELIGHHRESLGFGLANLAASAQQLDTPLVTAGAGAYQAGLYAAGGRLLGPLTFLANSLGMVAAPWLARAGADDAALRGEERRVLRVGAGLCLAPLVAAVAGPPLIPLLLGPEYASSGTVFAVLALGAAVVTLNQPFAVIAQNRGHQRAVAAGIAIGLTIGLLATLVLSWWGGAVWAAVGYVVSQVVIFVLLGLAARRARRNGVAGVAPVVPEGPEIS